MRKVWIEAALNGARSRKFQPGIPDTVEAIIAEGVACARAGATIIHTHAYDGGGPRTFDWQVYARIIEGIPRGCFPPAPRPTSTVWAARSGKRRGAQLNWSCRKPR